MINSKPLRFVVSILLLWAAMRIWMTYPIDAGTVGAPAFDAVTTAATTNLNPDIFPASLAHLPSSAIEAPRTAASRYFTPAPLSAVPYVPGPKNILKPMPPVGQAPSSFRAQTQDLIAPVPLPVRSSSLTRRLSGYAWLFARDGGEPGLAGAGLLGGSQAGIRLNYAVAEDLAATMRVSRPLEDRGGEVALGVYWKPSPTAPFTIIAERRIGLERNGRNAFALIAAGGIAGVDLPSAFTLDLYGQTGLVGMKARDPFIDASSTVSAPVVQLKDTILSGGIGVWGSAQPGLSRVDLGPRVRSQFTAGGTTIAASLDWRQRIAGRAHPRSGLALTLEAGF